LFKESDLEQQKRPGIACMAEDNRWKVKHCSGVLDCTHFFGMCRITGCNPALFGATTRGAFVPGAGLKNESWNCSRSTHAHVMMPQVTPMFVLPKQSKMLFFESQHSKLKCRFGSVSPAQSM
jgi:hypothetical protein